MTSKPEAVESLVELGLTEYEARCFAALTQLSDGTAKEISQLADVPQSRVYDIADRLYQRGLIDVQDSNPQRYLAMPIDVAVKRLRQDYRANLETASQRLQELESRETDTDGVWKIADRQDVVNRIVMHTGKAEDEVYLLVGAEELLEAEVLDALADASEDGVTAFVEVPSESARDRVHEVAPNVEVAVSDLPLESVTVENREPGRLLMTDRKTVLMSALTEGLVPSETDETGVWGTEVGHGLVVWIRPLLEIRLDRMDFQSADD